MPFYGCGPGGRQARHLVRLVRLGDGIGIRMYLTNVCDPQVLSLGEVAQLSARRWDIENRLHWRRDVTLGEDQSQVRTTGALLCWLPSIVLCSP
jgi:Transposase DDE domain